MSVCVFWMLVCGRLADVEISAGRAAPKNHSLSRTIGPPRVISWVYCSSSRRAAAGRHVATTMTPGWSHRSSGVVFVHDGFEKFVRQLPLNRLPPLLVMALTTPPVK